MSARSAGCEARARPCGLSRVRGQEIDEQPVQSGLGDERAPALAPPGGQPGADSGTIER